MADEHSVTDFDAAQQADERAVETALAQARAELSAMNDAASTADQTEDDTSSEYSLHNVEGVGRYAVVRNTGWRPLLKVIHNREANIDFSANAYPGFDGVIGDHFKDKNNHNPSPWLFDPLSEDFEAHRNLRDNIAAVRNFLMQSYYVDTPAGMTPEKASHALEEIAAYVGKGLNNNYRFLGLVPNHDPKNPFISISDASASGGKGAQYLYEKILEMHRQSTWTRPFAAVLALFGGKAAPDWMLPGPDQTQFTDFFEHDMTHGGHGTDVAVVPVNAQEAVSAKINDLEAARATILARHQMNIFATDFDAIGNYLLASAGNMQNVATLSEPVKRDAIDIAKDILRKMKVTLGDIDIMNGLKLPPRDDASTLGSLKGVAMVYERLVGWARGVDSSIMQHPSVIAATQAIGQMGYLAKLEALRMAKNAGNTALAENLSGQLARIPDAFAKVTDGNRTFGSLLDKVERGIDTIMSRKQTITGPGAKIGFSATNELGSMSMPPAAGVGQHTTTAASPRDPNSIALQQAQALAAQDNNMRIQASRRSQAPSESAVRTQPRASQPLGRQMFSQVRTNKQSAIAANAAAAGTVVRPSSPANVTPAQLAALRNNTHHHEQEELEHQLQLKHTMDMQRAVKAQQKAAQQQQKPNVKTAKTDDAKLRALLGGNDQFLKDIGKATSTHGLVGPAVNPVGKGQGHVASVQAAKVTPQVNDPNDPNKYPPVHPVPPRGYSR